MSQTPEREVSMLKKIADTVYCMNLLYKSLSVLDLDTQIDNSIPYYTSLIEFKSLYGCSNWPADEVKAEITKRCPDLEPDLQIMLWQYIDYH